MSRQHKTSKYQWFTLQFYSNLIASQSGRSKAHGMCPSRRVLCSHRMRYVKTALKIAEKIASKIAYVNTTKRNVNHYIRICEFLTAKHHHFFTKQTHLLQSYNHVQVRSCSLAICPSNWINLLVLREAVLNKFFCKLNYLGLSTPHNTQSYTRHSRLLSQQNITGNTIFSIPVVR